MKMREEWIVSVQRRITDADGETEFFTEFEATAPTAERLARFAPEEVRAALGAVPTGDSNEPQAKDESYGTPDGPVAASDQPKRKRRTKAEIAADEAAAAKADLGADVTPERAPEPMATVTDIRPPEPAAEAAPAGPAAPYNPFAQ